MDIAAILRRAAWAQGRSTRSLALATGIPPSTMQRFMSEQNQLGLAHAGRLADELGLVLVERPKRRGTNK